MRYALLVSCFLAVACSGSASAGPLAADRPETRASASLAVASSSFAAGGSIPLAYSAYGANRSPALRWSALPPKTKSLALMMEDPDAMARPFIHWLAWNIDPAAGGLAEGSVPAGVRQGRNGRGADVYFGPRPHGPKPHHYHFQLFALDRTLDLPSGASREQLLAAMNRHVLAKGDLIGLFAEPRR